KDEDGTPTGEFGVANAVTVAEALKMAMEAAGIDLTGVPPPRNNSAQNTWASSYVAKAEELHLPVVVPERNVHESATRGEVIAMILHALTIPIGVQEDRVRGMFTDIPDNHPYRREILSAFVFGIIQGDTDAEGNPADTFRPDDPINRAEISKVIALVKEAFR
ncbi:MAG: S-layer homology domain-containing protein, partial [Patescibacteria group bacterium]